MHHLKKLLSKIRSFSKRGHVGGNDKRLLLLVRSLRAETFAHLALETHRRMIVPMSWATGKTPMMKITMNIEWRSNVNRQENQWRRLSSQRLPWLNGLALLEAVKSGFTPKRNWSITREMIHILCAPLSFKPKQSESLLWNVDFVCSANHYTLVLKPTDQHRWPFSRDHKFTRRKHQLHIIKWI